jgi:hypothetical protein
MRIEHVRQTIATALLLAVAGAALIAHDFWIEPSTFTPAVNTAVRVRLMVGDHFVGEALPRNDGRIERFFAVGPDGTARDIAGRHGIDPAGVVRFDAPGLYLLGYHGRPSAVNLDAATFEAYLVEEGLEHISRERAARGETGKPGREQFARSVKTLIRAGTPASAGGYDRAIGLPLEIIPEADPFAADLRQLPVRLLFDGRPVEGALVVAMRQATSSGAKGEVLSSARTNGDGRALLRIAPGVLLVKAVRMERAPSGSEADWSSTWTSLTLATEVADRRPRIENHDQSDRPRRP